MCVCVCCVHVSILKIIIIIIHIITKRFQNRLNLIKNESYKDKPFSIHDGKAKGKLFANGKQCETNGNVRKHIYRERKKQDEKDEKEPLFCLLKRTKSNRRLYTRLSIHTHYTCASTQCTHTYIRISNI